METDEAAAAAPEAPKEVKPEDLVSLLPTNHKESFTSIIYFH